MKRYRTLVRAKMVQQSAWTGGGTKGDPAAQDSTVARDGLGRPTMTGSSLAGALVATAARIIPRAWENAAEWGMVSGKRSEGREDADFRQSVWRFRASHPESKFAPETRDGVGIRQKTGATAVERRAKYDLEVLPKGTRWPFFLEIDTETGGKKSLALALRALDEWRHGRCWLGASAARGLGRMKLEEIEVLHLPLEKEFISLWPDSSLGCEDAWRRLRDAGAAAMNLDEALAESAGVPLSPGRDEPWEYLELEFTLAAGMQEDGYGWNSVSTGGGPWLGFAPPIEKLAAPPGMEPSKWKKQAGSQDHPVLVTSAGPGRPSVPAIAGSSLRGSLRHEVSRLARKAGIHVDDPLAVPQGQLPAPSDPAASVFGWLDQDSALLAGDAVAGADHRLALLMMHAEDEFTAGVHASSLHNRTCVMSGTFRFAMVLEAPCAASLKDHLGRLLPALEAAGEGRVPVGGANWRGHGWIPWKLEKARRATAGSGGWIEVQNAALGAIGESLATSGEQGP